MNRCGDCRWWHHFNTAVRVGKCLCPAPVWASMVSDCEREMWAKEGQDCPCFEAAQADPNPAGKQEGIP